MLELAAQLHHVGGIGISGTILLKPGRLTDEDRSSMDVHAEVGADVLSAHGDMLKRPMIRHGEIGTRLPES